ncbi:MAG TPA: hypothetical protein VKX16_16325 [Chloroflexota bacterium]|nr:hypothetical protein [Chloroflexota bacterium]
MSKNLLRRKLVAAAPRGPRKLQEPRYLTTVFIHHIKDGRITEEWIVEDVRPSYSHF